MNRREVADLRTRFSIEGLDAVKAAFRETSSALNSVRESTRQYQRVSAGAVKDSQTQLVAAKEAAQAAREQIDAVRKANAERQRGSNLAGQGIVAQAKAELDASIAAQKQAAAELKKIRRPGQGFRTDADFDAFEARKKAAQDALVLARKVAQANADSYRGEVKAAKAAADEIRKEGDAALKAAIANAEKKARAEEAAAARISKAIVEARKAEVEATKAAAAAVEGTAAQKLKIRQAEQKVELEAAKGRETIAREQGAAAAKAAKAKEIADRKAAQLPAKLAKDEARATEKAAKDGLAAQKKAIADRERAEKESAARLKRLREILPTGGAFFGLAGAGLGIAGRGAIAGAGAAARGGLAGATGLVGTSARASRALTGIGVAAVRTTAQITASLGTTALGTLTALASQAQRVASSVARIGVRAGAAGVALGAGTFGLAKKATGKASDETLETVNFSRATGLTPEDFSVLSDAASKFGIDVGDLRGSLIQFQGQVKAAVNDPNGDLGKYFREMGVEVTDANGKAKQTGALLLDVIEKSKRLDQTSRIDFLSKAFGEDDSGKLLPLFDQIGAYGELLSKTRARQEELGSFITPRDYQIALQYRNAVKDLGSAWKGVSLEIANAVGPDVSNLLTALANDIGRNRVLIATYFQQAFFRFYSVTRDIVRALFFGAEYGAATAENPWVASMLRGYMSLRDGVMAAVRFVKEAQATIAGDDAKVVEFPWLIGIREGITGAITYVKRFAFELKAALYGEEYNLGSAEFPWIFAIKAGIQAVVADVKLQWNDLLAALTTGGATTALGVFVQGLKADFDAAKAVVLDFTTTIGKIWDDFSKIFANFGDRNALKSEVFNYAFLKSAGDGFYFLANAAKEGWEWFSKLYNVVFDLFRDYLGLNFESVVFFGAILTFSGVARVLTFLLSGLGVLLKGLLSPIKLVVGALGIGAGAAATAGLAGAVTGIGTAATTAGAAAAAATTKWGGLAGVFARIAGLLGGPLGLLLGIGGVAYGAYSLFKGTDNPTGQLAALGEALGKIKSDLGEAEKAFKLDDVTAQYAFNRQYVADQAKLASATGLPMGGLNDPRRFSYDQPEVEAVYGGTYKYNGGYYDSQEAAMAARQAAIDERQAMVTKFYADKNAANVGPQMPNPTIGAGTVPTVIPMYFGGEKVIEVNAALTPAEIQRIRMQRQRGY
ncbi:hypothetical protein [Bosea sp. (in: a-proteobacteria)]|uniref:hypothetical protein n=1 Tax=Bosea sp. (in: a-proteobacteria) TaxID=1871050 RepID=UPI002736658B|nr:hypothetical protein [Bosea sp. (in: a-proteobacteria)]MDP3408071.1 hypothetical protein [Bosea sp. (in: a-proteobacteria)]